MQTGGCHGRNDASIALAGRDLLPFNIRLRISPETPFRGCVRLQFGKIYLYFSSILALFFTG
jgi:hypothetical protein